MSLKCAPPHMKRRKILDIACSIISCPCPVPSSSSSTYPHNHTTDKRKPQIVQRSTSPLRPTRIPSIPLPHLQQRLGIQMLHILLIPTLLSPQLSKTQSARANFLRGIRLISAYARLKRHHALSRWRERQGSRRRGDGVIRARLRVRVLRRRWRDRRPQDGLL